MIKKILGILLILFLLLFTAHSAINVLDNQDSSRESQEPTIEISSQLQDIITLPSRDERVIEFDSPITIGGKTGTKFEYDNFDDYVQIMEARNANREVGLTGDSADKDIYYIKSTTENGQVNEIDPNVPYYQLVTKCEEDPMSCGSDLYSQYKQIYGDNFDIENQNEIYDRVVEIEDDLENNNDLTPQQREELQQELSQKKNFLKNTMTGSEFVNDVLKGQSPEDIQNALNDCSGITNSISCFFGNKITAETKARETVIEAKQEITQGKTVTNNCPEGKECISVDDYNEELKNKLNQEINFENVEGCDSISCDTNQISCDDNDKTCINQKQIIETLQEEQRQQEYKSFSGWTAGGYTVLKSLMNPDSQGIEASQFFGLESDLSDLPSILGEDFPSQVCLYEIDGYLDSTKSTNVNGVGGVSQYSCLEGRNCVDIIGDIRAQKTPLTPDNTIEVSLSGFIQAPENDSIEMKIYANYIIENENVEELLFNTTVSRNSRESVFEVYELPGQEDVNFSNYDDTNEITINLVGKYTSGGTYVDLTTPAYSVVEGVEYDDPLRQQ